MPGLNAARLSRIEDVMAGYVERGDVPGVVSLVARDDDIHVFWHGSIAKGGAPMRRDTIFRIASMTKPVTAVATLMCAEDSLFRLDDPVDDLLPELANRRVLTSLSASLDETVPANRQITIRDLLTFTWGYGQVLAPPDAYPITGVADTLKIGNGPPDPLGTPPPDEWIKNLGSLPLMFQPGEMWMYNTGSDVLAVLVARASGRPFDEFLRERIFEPLEMSDTGFFVPEEKVSGLATAYWTNPATMQDEVYDAPSSGAYTSRPAVPSGGGGLVSTVDDFLQFAQMLLDGGGDLISRSSVAAMTTDQLEPHQKKLEGWMPGLFDGRGWGFGCGIVTKRNDIHAGPGRYGWDGGLGTTWFNDPNERLIGIALTQVAWKSPRPPEICRDLWTLAYAALP